MNIKAECDGSKTTLNKLKKKTDVRTLPGIRKTWFLSSYQHGDQNVPGFHNQES